MNLLRAWTTLFWLSYRRLLWSANTLMVLFPLAGCGLFLLRRRYDRMDNLAEAFQSFSNFLVLVFVSFVVPVCALAFGTASVGGDREDRTLLFVLVRPIPRPLVLLAKFFASLPLALGLVVGSFLVFCELAGKAGALAGQLYLPAVFYMTVAYVGLFHLFAVSLRHSTIVALIYALLMEMLLGNMPGIVKRVAVNYYGRSLMYAAGHGEGLGTPSWFEPISPSTAAWVLALFGAGGLALALVVFQRREYRDLT